MNSVFFSLYVVEGLRRLGVELNQRERESVILTWRYLNHLLGVDPDISFRSEAGARRLADVAFSLEFDPDETSKKLYPGHDRRRPRIHAHQERAPGARLHRCGSPDVALSARRPIYGQARLSGQQAASAVPRHHFADRLDGTDAVVAPLPGAQPHGAWSSGLDTADYGLLQRKDGNGR